MRSKATKAGLAFLALAVVLTLPLWAGSYWIHVAILGLYYVIMASSWNLLVGYTGLMSFAHVSFATMGGYVSTLAATRLGLPPAVGLLLGISVAAIAGYLLGALCLRMRGVYHSLATLAFAEAFRTMLNLEYKVTRGSLGLLSVPLYPGTSKIPYYYTALALTGVVLIILDRIIRSPVGFTLQAIREDQTAASVTGVPLTHYKLFAFALSSGMAGLAGAFLSHYLGIVTPDWATQTAMSFILAMAIMGGLGTFAGPIIGAMGVEFLMEYLRVFGRYYMSIFGLLVLLMLRFTPGGLVALISGVRVWLNRRRQLVRE
ncbi:MAG TPA: branched-chain amino acid ABC transporter permease [Anaerolineae bacterium]|nr:branched-chain amino acid ABC transporter permease [Anaerolineae bacterium]